MMSMIMGLIGMISIASGGTKQTSPEVVTTNPLHCVHVTDVGGHLVNGCYDVSRFVEQNGSLWAVCKLKGTCDGVDIEEDCLVPITVGDCNGGLPRLTQSGGDCECLVIKFGNCTVPTPRLTIEVSPAEQTCTPADYPAELLCKIVSACNTIGTPRLVIATMMNDLL